MPLSFDFEFFYPTLPRITVVLNSLETGRSGRTGALLDTGAEVTPFDRTIGERLGVDILNGPRIRISGVGGALSDARLASVEVALLGEPELTISLPVAFAAIEGLAVGNLIGLDVLSHFDFGLSHRDRLGYPGRTA